MPKRPHDFNIEIMVRDPDWLGDTDIAIPQLAVLKGIYGLALTKEELEAWLELTEGRRPRKGGYFEATLCVGVRSGKTEKIGSNIMTYQAITFDREAAHMAPGEIPYIGVIAQNKEGAAQNFGYLEGKAVLLEEKGWSILDHGTAQERAITGLQIRYATGVVAQIFPAKKAATRNKTMIGGLADEIAWWETEEVKVNADVEICRALRQRMQTTGAWAKFIKLGSPFMEHGVLFDEFEKRATSLRLFVRCASWVFKPMMLTDPHERARMREAERDDPEGFLRDYGAQFGKAGGAFYTAAEVDGAMRADRPLVIEPRPDREYRAWIDAAFRRDLFPVAIGHREGERVVFDLVHVWKPERGQPLDPGIVAAELVALLKPYRITRLGSDAVADAPLRADLARADIAIEVQRMSTAENNEMHRNFKAALRRNLIELPKEDIIRADILSCVKNGRGNSYRIEAPNLKGFHDDITKVCAAVTIELMPPGSLANLEELNAGAVKDRDRLFKERGFQPPEDAERLPSDFMSQVF